MVVKKKVFLLKCHILENLANTICVRKVQKARIFVATICFWKWSFLCPYKVTKHCKNRGFSRHRRKPQMALLVAKCHFGKGPRKGGIYYLWYLKKLCFAENTIFIVLSAKHSFADMKECNLKKKQNFAKNRGLFAKMQKGVYLVCFFGFLVVLFLFLRVFVFLFCKRGPKRLFSCNLDFVLSCSPKRPIFKILLFFLFCFIFLFSLCLPFQNSSFLWFCPSTPFWKTLLFLASLVFHFLASSFPSVCLFLWNKLS